MTFSLPTSKFWNPRVLIVIFVLNAFIYTILLFHSRTFDFVGKWAFNSTRDSKNFGLSEEQCTTAFRGLFTEIERAVRYRKTIGQVRVEEIDISSEKDVATGGMLYIIEAHISLGDHPRMRALATLNAIHRALLTSPVPIPNSEFSFSVNDILAPSPRPIWALTRLATEPEKWVMSDFGYWAWSRALMGGYEEMRAQIAELEKPFEEKIPKVVWRGDRKNNVNRVKLIAEAEGKEWADVRDIQWRDARHVTGYDADSTITVPEHCLYQFVIQTEGWSYSGRGKYLQNCNSVVIIPKRIWIEPQHALIVSSGPLQNFVEIEEDYSDLETVMEELLANPEKAKMIAQNGVDAFRDRALTPAAQACYWRKMLVAWAEVSPKAERWEHVEGGRIGKRRGVDFETYIVEDHDGLFYNLPIRHEAMQKLQSR
ncbi:putative protein O-glucosyltransferase 1 [Glarea lozoyensis 74030]|uniref:Glycosyl transferase CAP10 domain-containing protein n=1 Tax=Glarea lozoyensis (strain ATCC 74030 / MF5533) TaxID=1104152 RepID=H0EZM3_GLAL7|nr:putative protein O-glucosyltransferase 1 [Glarea lozoyensis 74030]